MKKWIIGLVCTIVVAAIIVGAIFLIPKNDDNAPPVEESIEIVCKDITISLNDKPVNLGLKVIKKGVLTYTKKISTDSDCIKIFGDLVIPKKVGTANVTIEISTTNNKYTKEVSVTVKPVDCDINLIIQDDLGNNINKLFVGENYNLIVTVNKKLNYDYNVSTSKNISQFKLIESKNNYYKFNFKVESLEKTQFLFEYLGDEELLEINTYEYIRDINIKINNELSNEINLDLFNPDYRTLANENGLYDSCTFNIIENNNCINEYKVEVSNENIARIEENNIIAINGGICDLIVSALDGSDYIKIFKIYVNNSNIQNLNFESAVVELEQNQVYELNANYYPIYSINNIEYYLDDKLIEDTNISFDAAGEYIIIAKDVYSNISTQLKIIVKESSIKYNFELSFSDSFLQECNGKFENDVLTISSSASIDVYFSISIQDCPYDLSCTIEFTNDNIVSGWQQYSNVITIGFLSQGETFVKLMLKENIEVSYTFKIVVL